MFKQLTLATTALVSACSNNHMGGRHLSGHDHGHHSTGNEMMDMLKSEDTVGEKTIVKINDAPAMYIDYYIKRKDFTMPDNTVMSVHEFHGNCFSEDLDVRNCEEGSKYSCELGFYYDDEPNKVDWMALELPWAGVENISRGPMPCAPPINHWSCVDGVSTDATSWLYTPDTV